MKRIIKPLTAGAGLAVDFWIVASWANVAASNMAPGASLAGWNVFKLLF